MTYPELPELPPMMTDYTGAGRAGIVSINYVTVEQAKAYALAYGKAVQEWAAAECDKWASYWQHPGFEEKRDAAELCAQAIREGKP